MIAFVDKQGIAHIDHTKAQVKARAMSTDALRWSIADASAAAKAMPNGHKAGYYADEVCIYSDELRRRGART